MDQSRSTFPNLEKMEEYGQKTLISSNKPSLQLQTLSNIKDAIVKYSEDEVLFREDLRAKIGRIKEKISSMEQKIVVADFETPIRLIPQPKKINFLKWFGSFLILVILLNVFLQIILWATPHKEFGRPY
jgi:hypothetical protein